MFAFLCFFVEGFLVYSPCMLRVAFLLPSSNKFSVLYLSKKKKSPVLFIHGDYCPVLFIHGDY